MERIVSLPWYDAPSSRRSLDVFWSVLRGALHDEGVDRLPEHLDRTTPLEMQWSHSELLLSQCCGLDLFTSAAHALVPVGRPVFSLPCEPGNYFSYIVAAPGAKLSPQRLVRTVINSPSSRSGCTALLSWLKEGGWTFQNPLASGSHRASADLVRRCLADIAAIDAHSWRLMGREGLEIIGESAQAPTPPFISHLQSDVPRDVLLRALSGAVARRGEAIGVLEVTPTDREVYRALADEAARLEVARRMKLPTSR